MNDKPEQSQRMMIAQSVRGNAGSVAIAAVLLIYFGFFAGLVEPTGPSLFDRGNWLFLYTLRAGGIAMAAIAVWSLSGQALVLLVDAFVSVGIGLLFALTGVMMLIDGGGTQAFLNVIFGVLFVSAGVRNGREYSSFADRVGDRSPTFHPADRVPPAPSDTWPEPPGTSLARQLRERARSAPLPAARPIDRDDDGAADTPSPPRPTQQEQKPPPPDGFLASFANEEPPPRI